MITIIIISDNKKSVATNWGDSRVVDNVEYEDASEYADKLYAQISH